MTRISQSIRRSAKRFGIALLAGIATVRAVAGEAADTPSVPPAPVTAAQQQLKAMFPEAYTQAAAEFGWRQYRDGKWGALPERLPKRVVVLVHGVDEPGKLWINLAPAVVRAGYAACEFRYPNDQPIRPSAAYLLHSLKDLRARGTTAVIIVAHSMGGLVSREMLTHPQLDFAGHVKQERVPAARHLIMLCTPNHGSPWAHARFAVEMRDQCMRLFNGNGHPLSGWVDGTGEAGKDLVPDSEFLKSLNSRPNPPGIALTIIAGIASPISKDGLAALAVNRKDKPAADQDGVVERCQAALESVADGVGDGCVSVSSARLAGVADFVTVAGTHLSTVRNVLDWDPAVPPSVPLVLERLAKDWPLPPAAKP